MKSTAWDIIYDMKNKKYKLVVIEYDLKDDGDQIKEVLPLGDSIHVANMNLSKRIQVKFAELTKRINKGK